jgi:uncharacterized protein YuzE
MPFSTRHEQRKTRSVVSFGPYTFENVSYDAEIDVLYLHKGEPSTAVDFDESPEGHALRFDVEQNLVGVAIVGVKRLLEQDGKVTITVPRVVRVDAEAVATVIGTVCRG